MVLNECFDLACRVVKIYDSRCLKKTNSKAISQLHGHALSITSAYFSPWTGNRVLTSSLDNHLRWGWLSTLKNCVAIAVIFSWFWFFSPSSMSLPIYIDRVYDTSEMTTKSPLLTSIRYNHLFHRWCAFLFCCLSSVLWDLWHLNLITHNLHFQTWHANRPLADQTISSVGPQTGGLFCGGEHVESPEGAGVPRKRSATAHLHRSRELKLSAVRHSFPPHEERLTGWQCIRAPAHFLRLRWRPKRIWRRPPWLLWVG